MTFLRKKKYGNNWLLYILLALTTAVAISSNNERQKSTYLYAGLEDGSLYRIDVESSTSIKFNLLSENELNPIAPAMATFTRATDGKDVIIISGEMSDGAVVTVSGISIYNVCVSIWMQVLISSAVGNSGRNWHCRKLWDTKLGAHTGFSVSGLSARK